MAAGLTRSEWARVRKVFDELMDLDPSARPARLRTLDLDARLAGEVASLLAASESEGVLDLRAGTGGDETKADYSSLQAGAKVGAFVVDRLIGRGGAGEVYLAHRSGAGFDQAVAIKLLRPEAVDRMGLFDRERRVLATLEHPGIARLIDGGLAPDGRAFMAMEYVDGADIVSWCTANKADLTARLGLFNQVCEAVSYAHRRLVVHRDIKPSNIIIDRDGRARLLDFGVARLLEATADGQTGTLPMLTPEYAAPEQLENRPPTTAADVYGLGAVLFELLTGRGPWGFDDAPMPVILRRLLHDDPPLPSKAATGNADAAAPAKRLSGDLDAIVLKAMRRNPGDRYDSVAALSDDLERHQTSRPVKARDGTGLYLTQRFARRHKWAVTATAAGLLTVMVGAGGIAWQARATAVERDVARTEAARAEAVNQSVSLMFRNAGASGRGGSATARELLDTSAEQLLSRIDPRDPDQAAVVLALAELYGELEDPAAMEALLEKALVKGVGRGDPVTTANVQLQLGAAKAALNKFDEARAFLAKADAVWRTEPARYRQQRQEAVGAEARMLRAQGDAEDGVRLLLATMPEMERAWPPGSRDRLTRYNNLAVHLIGVRRLEEAAAYLARAEEEASAAGVTRTAIGLSLLQTRSALAAVRNDFPAAVQGMKQAADLRRELYGPSGALAGDLLNYGRTTMALGNPEEALSAFDEAQSMAVHYLGSETFVSFMIVVSRIDALCALNRPDEADRLLPEVQRRAGRAGAGSLEQGMFNRTRAYVRLTQGRHAEARADLDAAERIYRALGPKGVQALEDVRTLKGRLAGS